ncbi:MAG: copper amine oxidase N-terminal domain-containing protein [Defluviitaleaceae bacterium]|nr:copper amine oxidase N-terminal domain-containing protein [Defluviitaleaceae bacterium]
MKNRKKREIILSLALVTIFVFSTAAIVFAQELGHIERVEIHDMDSNSVESVDVVSGATRVFNVFPLDAEGSTYGEFEERSEARGDYFWFDQEVTFVLGRYVDDELYIADRFFNGEWGGIRVGWGRRNFLFVHLSEENNRTNVELIEPGSYDFYVFAVSGDAPMPNPPIPASEFPYLEDAASAMFTVNVLNGYNEHEYEAIESTEALASHHSVLVDGELVAFRAFNIGGSNFFMLRDIAYALNGTSSQFEVGWDDGLNAITLMTGMAYTPVGGEMSPPEDAPATALRNIAARVYVDGEAIDLLSYNIGGNNFFMLRYLGDALGFEVNWDDDTSSVLIDTN